VLQTQKSTGFILTRANLTWLPIITLWVVFIGLLYYFIRSSPFGLKAFEVYFVAADNLFNGIEMIYQGTNGWIYLYPPLLGQMLMPLTIFMEYQAASNFWLSLNIALLLITLFVMQRYAPFRWSRWLWVLPVVFLPVWQAMYIGQITIIMLVLLTWIWVAVRQGHNRLAGFLLATAAWIKVFPGVLVVYFIYKRNWQLLIGAIGGGLLLLLVQVLLSGPQTIISFFEVLYALFSQGQPSATYENLSIFGFASRLFQENHHVHPLWRSDTLFMLTRWGLTGGIIILTMLTVYFSTRRSRHHALSWRFDLEYGMVILTILLLGSTLWISGLPPLVLISLLIIRHRRHQQMRRVRFLWWLAFGLIMIHQPIIVLTTLFNLEVNATILSVGFFGLMMAWGLMAWLLIFEPEPTLGYNPD
jgi:hypothetical protein